MTIDAQTVRCNIVPIKTEQTNMPIRATLFALSGLAAFTAIAQDSLFYTNGTVIVGQVEEVGLNAVTYHTNSEGNQVRVVVDKQELSRVKLKGGQAYSFISTTSEESYSAAFEGRKHALSLELIAPALNHLTIGYEQVLAPRISLVASAGYIGLWDRGTNDDVFNSKGGLVTAGVKFILPRSTKHTSSKGDVHPLAGWYLKPELMYSAWSSTSYYNDYYGPYYYYLPVEVKTSYASAALTLSIGRQLFLGEHITFDISGGLGYGTEWRDGKATQTVQHGSDRQEYAFTHAFFGNTSPLVMRGGLRFGYVF